MNESKHTDANKCEKVRCDSLCMHCSHSPSARRSRINLSIWSLVDSGPGGRALLFDPGGSFMQSTRGSGDVLSGSQADLATFLAFHADPDTTVETFVFDTSPQEEGQIGQNALDIGGVAGGLCGLATNDALSGVGPFSDLGPRLLNIFPGNLGRQLSGLSQ